ncbi:trigger factor [Rufibacter glacialis]|uniref:Trigger factor n=1 Tax=Rufibacter glacialis TaxID=1259555 RepID=A0A5M8QLQ5_9BACT|nr:trigger factor [Rufibacter glacialis]KAA6435900.1 trigger factor [Rufibacter glacialis]GGK67503.1 trigger factor [Rufibacter glacialis]
MNITLNQTDGQNASLKVSLQEADYAARVDEQIKDYSKKASIKGFRPGKVPAGLIRKMYGKGILVESINQLLHESVNNYIKENKLRILGEPLPDRQDENAIDWDTQKEFEFSYAVGLLPEFELPLSEVSVQKYDIEVDQTTVDEAYEQMQRQFGQTTNPEVSEANDYLYGDLKQVDGEFETKTLLPLNKVVAGAEKFVGVKPGDTITFDIREAFGDDAALAHVTGLSKEVTKDLNGQFTFVVEKINRTENAEMNQEFFDKIFGQGNVTTQEEFDAKVREVIKENYDREAVNVLDRDVIDQIVEKSSIEIPDAFFKRWLAVTNEGKITPEQIDEFYDQYVKELKWSMIRNKVVEENDLKVSNEDVVNSARQKMMAQFNMPEIPEEMADTFNNFLDNHLKQNNGKNFVNEYEALVAEKVLEFVKEKITITENPITADEFRAKVGA